MIRLRTDKEVASRDKIYEKIERALQDMPSDLREIFVLRHYRGKTIGEIATARNQDRSSLERLLSRANRAFYAALNRTVVV